MSKPIPYDLVRTVLDWVATDYQEPSRHLDAEREYYEEKAFEAAERWVKDGA